MYHLRDYRSPTTSTSCTQINNGQEKLPASAFHGPEVLWVIVTIIGLSYVRALGCVTIQTNYRKQLPAMLH
ncbi:hypothetical protein [Paenibacillus sp. sgz5001063]|uniref:hypothetical protein n=1 Tax=Paenibacillus sp. sgz5001063 TaxID=3242474 RepID=UPI0036D2F740